MVRSYLDISVEVIGLLTMLHGEGLYGLYSSPDTIRVIKLRRMSWAVHVARVVTINTAYSVLW
jgi:hypothetical protein